MNHQAGPDLDIVGALFILLHKELESSNIKKRLTRVGVRIVDKAQAIRY